jgi:hypothetical protein
MVLSRNKGTIAFINKYSPLYEELCIVYAKYHAIGKDAQASVNIYE